MTEEKSTTRKTPAAKKTPATVAASSDSAVKAPAAKTAAPAAAEKDLAVKAPAAKKAAPAAAEKKAPAKKAPPAAVETDSPLPAATECATTADPATPVQPSPEDRYRMVQSAAYFIAEKDGFQHGRDAEYWARAEHEVAVQLGEAAA
ncbi:MAG: DUF2934 domain-containing protein [Candidatus Accumulibacter sp.]|uniref:DUF2934 domain-containing protein n=1 Tax=Candidatus Accumulibacter proximus TaxID=2954385 RepID=A0A935UJE9_9PROT|nr:DUF2934 domain-containing protein [Candidatus Accumulibacter proximus]